MGSMKQLNSLVRTRVQTNSLFRAEPVRAGGDIKIVIKSGRKSLSVETTEARHFAHALMEVSRKTRDELLLALQASAVEILDAVRIAERG